MAKTLFKDLFPFKTSGIALDQRFRALIRDLNSYLGQYFTPNSDGKGGFQIESADGLDVVGNIGPNDFGVLKKKLGGALVINSIGSLFLKVNNYWDGTADRFLQSVPAYQIFSTTSPSQRLVFRENTNTPVAGQPITWSADRPLFPESGSNSNGHWVRYADGTQMCWVRFTPSSNSTWLQRTLPNTFVDTNYVLTVGVSNGNGDSNQFNILWVRPVSTSVFEYYSHRTDPAYFDPVNVMAIGRWY